jgi:putative N6-adenine-specific DNA methylase
MFTLGIEAAILVTCPKGLSPYLAEEMRRLGHGVDQRPAGVRTTGTLTDCLGLNLHSRVGHRVLYRLMRFGADHPDAVYRKTRSLPWEEIFDPGGYLSVHSSVSHPSVRDTRFPNLRVKDAVADRFIEACGARPDSGPDQARGVNVFLYWHGTRAELFLDTTGVPLSRRGYRLKPHAAPMQETLAAAVIAASGWDPATDFLDPMCGSGTLAVEAALMARNLAPGLLRHGFSFAGLREFDPAAWAAMRREARDQALESAPGRIMASDRDPEAVAAARENATAAGVAADIAFSVGDFRDQDPGPGPGVCLVNPEYGLRLGREEHLEATYAALGDFFKQKLPGWRAGVFTAQAGLAKRVGLKPAARIPFYSAKLACDLRLYDIWAGRRPGT